MTNTLRFTGLTEIASAGHRAIPDRVAVFPYGMAPEIAVCCVFETARGSATRLDFHRLADGRAFAEQLLALCPPPAPGPLPEHAQCPEAALGEGHQMQFPEGEALSAQELLSGVQARMVCDVCEYRTYVTIRGEDWPAPDERS